jgi:voltage-gated sodium channel
MIEQPLFQRIIIGAIILNAIALGLETVPSVATAYGPVLRLVDLGFIALFCGEILLKLVAYRIGFFRSGWNVFDLTIVAISVLPFLQGISVLRALRVLRVLRLVSVVPQFRKVTQAFFDSLAGLAAIGFILSLLFYIGAVMSTKLFGEEFPGWFGSIGTSLFSLFQIMTLESWSSAIARPVMEVYPFAWAFFVPFILLTTFAALNLLIGVIVNSMQGLHDETTDTLDVHMDKQDAERAALRTRVEAIEAALIDLKRRL